MEQNRPLFELIMEESRSNARQRKLSQPSPPPLSPKLPKPWFTRPHKKRASPSPSPSHCSSDYETAHDTFSWTLSPIQAWQGHLGLPCLQDDGERCLEVAMALDMMELRVAQACAERDVALSQALDLRFAIDSIRGRLHEVEQYCMHLNYQLFLSNSRTEVWN